MDCEGNGAPERAGRAHLAVLIDGENASPHHARAVFEATEALGDATVRRIYGDFSNGLLASRSARIRNFAIMPCHQPAHVPGTNAADIALAIDAVDLSYRVRSTDSCWSARTATSPGSHNGFGRAGSRSSGSAKAGRRGRSEPPANGSRSSGKGANAPTAAPGPRA